MHRLEIVRSQEECWQERYDGRLSRADLWERGGEIPLRYPTLYFSLRPPIEFQTFFGFNGIVLRSSDPDSLLSKFLVNMPIWNKKPTFCKMQTLKGLRISITDIVLFLFYYG